MSLFLMQLKRECLLMSRSLLECFYPVLFFLLFILLAVLSGVQGEAQVVVTLILMSVILALLYSLERLFYTDYQQGVMLHWFLSQKIYGFLVAKWLVHTLFNLIPLLIVVPLGAVWLGLATKALPVLLVSISLLVPTVLLLGALGQALTLGVGRGGLLTVVLLLPLYVPLVIFAATANYYPAIGVSPQGPLLLLVGLLCFSIIFVLPLTQRALDLAMVP